ncbi:cupredoxin domain-containing protein [Thiohalobacter sp. IOR34]|uniref:cupredoxin domain-containing protein n=1 Tax=Thiohalobacter sp. IOR34 TaxID=3057176 RepID=UPI0025AF1029|nr:cupredoxin domain-containing protein [Thiohalobacter sp. IOR34]WJW75430.1 cupredoxin domain-containing protein [Thiohalobacter sp. IOR34]
MKKWKAILLLALSLGLAASPAAAGGEDVVLVIIKDYKFIPAEVSIRRGQTVRWENHEKRQYHSVWFEALGEPEPDYFFPDESYERTFDQPGDFPYRCGPHPEMTGVVHVGD